MSRLADTLIRALSDRLTPIEKRDVQTEFTRLESTIKDIGSVIGPAGRGSRLFFGSVVADNGIALYNPETGYKTAEMLPSGDFVLGYNVEVPADTSFYVFSNDQTYNSENVGFGDVLLGDNSSGAANLLWDRSTGRLNFRGGTTVNTYIDTDGSLVASGATITGTITASAGTIGGWTINANSISKTTIVLDSANDKITVGGTDVVLDSDGITAVAGEIGGWTIDSTSLSISTISLDATSGISLVGASEATGLIKWYAGSLGGSRAGYIGTFLDGGSGYWTMWAVTEVGTQSNAFGIWCKESVSSGKTDHFLRYSNKGGLTFYGGLTVGSSLYDSYESDGNIRASGQIRAGTFFTVLGDGSSYGFKAGASQDCHLYRNAANQWYTPDQFWTGGALVSSSAIYSQGDGASYGFYAGAGNDCQLYRNAANQWYTPDQFWAGGAIVSSNIIYSQGDGSSYGFKAGAANDVHWYRSSANIWTTPDAVNVGIWLKATGYIWSNTDGAGYGFRAGTTGDVEWYRNAANVWRTPDTVQIDGDLYTAGWTDYSSTTTVVGYSSYVYKEVFYKKLGKLVFVQFHIHGTSNSATTSFTLPYTKATYAFYYSIPIAAINNGSAVAGAIAYMQGSTATITCFTDVLGNPWTASGTKSIRGQFFYEVA